MLQTRVVGGFMFVCTYANNYIHVLYTGSKGRVAAAISDLLRAQQTYMAQTPKTLNQAKQQSKFQNRIARV